MIPARPGDPSAAELSIPGIDLEIVDVVGAAATPERVRALQELHGHFFPDYPHVIPEIALNATGPGPYPGVVVHQWLLLRDGDPVGLYLFDTNTRRGIVLRHFVAVTQAGARGLSPLWLGPVAARIAEIGAADCLSHLSSAETAPPLGSAETQPHLGSAEDAAQRPATGPGSVQVPGQAQAGRLLGVASEIPRQLFPLWRRLGFIQLPQIGYAEPAHGMHWAAYDPEPHFHDITLNVQPSPASQQPALRQVADAAARGFLLDHYRLPADHPRVAAILAAIATL